MTTDAALVTELPTIAYEHAQSPAESWKSITGVSGRRACLSSSMPRRFKACP
jgi:hypothetical protein